MAQQENGTNGLIKTVNKLTLFNEESEEEEQEKLKVEGSSPDHNIDYIKSVKSWNDLTLP